MGQFRVQVAPAWLVTAMAIFGVNLAVILAVVQPNTFVPVQPTGPAGSLAAFIPDLRPKSYWVPGPPGARWARTLVRQMYDGSVVEADAAGPLYVYSLSGGQSQPIVVQPASVIGLCPVWWPVAVSIGGSLLILGVTRIGARRRSGQSVRRPRLTMIQVMAFIGLISFWLWLIRIGIMPVIIAGFFVTVVMLHAVSRRNELVDKAEAQGMSAPALSRVGIAGYSIAVLLALAWVITVCVWDLYPHGRP